METTTTADETHEFSGELIESGPTLLDYVDMLIKAVIAGALVIIAGRLA